MCLIKPSFTARRRLLEMEIDYCGRWINNPIVAYRVIVVVDSQFFLKQCAVIAWWMLQHVVERLWGQRIDQRLSVQKWRHIIECNCFAWDQRTVSHSIQFQHLWHDAIITENHWLIFFFFFFVFLKGKICGYRLWSNTSIVKAEIWKLVFVCFCINVYNIL